MSTVGLELEWADVDRWATINPMLGKWNTEDYSIVNSDGHANCPTGVNWRWGGEINTIPTRTAHAQGDIVLELKKQLNPTINYKCNLHVHVKPDVNLLEDLDRLKMVARWMREAETFVYSIVEFVPKPTRLEYPDGDEYHGAMKRYRRRLVSHQYRLPENRWNEMMSAKTIQEFYDAHAAPTATGGRAWHLAPRPGMNLRSLWKHGTIEYRHFPGTDDPDEIESCAEWCIRFTEAALEQKPLPHVIYKERTWKFPVFQPYNHTLHEGFELTKHK